MKQLQGSGMRSLPPMPRAASAALAVSRKHKLQARWGGTPAAPITGLRLPLTAYRLPLLCCLLGALWLFAAGSHHAAWAANEPISSPASSGGVIQPATAQQAYNETLAWATGINSQSYLNDLYLRLERES